MNDPVALLQREIERIQQLEVEGCLDHNEARLQIMDLEREYRDAAHDAAAEAYQRELENW